MIDKVWFDWQHRDPKNANSFFGNSVQALQSLDTYRRHPVGGPPYLSVSTDHTKIKILVLIRLHSLIRAYQRTGCSLKLLSEM